MGLPHSESIEGGDPKSCFAGEGKGFRLVCKLGFTLIEPSFEGHWACFLDALDEGELYRAMI